MVTWKAPVKAKGNEVDDFMLVLAHPLKAELEAVRRVILGTDTAIAEDIKWNAPSFRVGEYFATANIRGKDAIQIVFHLGTKVKDGSTAGMDIDDPKGLLEWHAKERASMKFRDMKEIKANTSALKDIVRQWIAYLR